MDCIVKSLECEDIYGEFYLKDEAHSLVVIFPGLKYGHSKPLLYYARKAAQMSGKDVICLNYERKLDWDDIGKNTIGVVAEQCYNIIGDCISKKKYKNIYFLSKSIGTEVAGSTAENMKEENIKHLYLTPTYAAVKYIEKFNGPVIVGTMDSIFEDKYIDRVKKFSNNNLMLIDGGDHSLEIKGDLSLSINVLKDVVNKYIDFFREE